MVIEQTGFEDWQPIEDPFRLVFSAQAWHWIAPERRYRRARAVLIPGGVLAAFWNRPDWDANPLREQIDDAYRRTVPDFLPNGPMRPGSSPDEWRRWEQEINSASGLGEAEVRGYRWDTEYSSREYVRLLRTHSDHIVLDRRRREDLYAAIETVIDEHADRFPLTYVTWLCLARAC